MKHRHELTPGAGVTLQTRADLKVDRGRMCLLEGQESKLGACVRGEAFGCFLRRSPSDRRLKTSNAGTKSSTAVVSSRLISQTTLRRERRRLFLYAQKRPPVNRPRGHSELHQIAVD